MALVLLLKLLKLVALSALVAGTVGALLPRDLADRRRAAHLLGGPGFLVTWGVGFGLAYLEGRSLFAGWILGTMALSFFSYQVVIFSVAAEGRRSTTTAALAVAPLVGCLALMVLKPG